jgi:hypothetical protein
MEGSRLRDDRKLTRDTSEEVEAESESEEAASTEELSLDCCNGEEDREEDLLKLCTSTVEAMVETDR